MLYHGKDFSTFEQNGQELIIRFVFDVPEDKKIKYHEQNLIEISEAVLMQHKDFLGLLRNVSSDPQKPKTLLEKHLQSYVAKNTFDYFIHKDLKSFLARELDFFIKNEVLHLDDLDTPDVQHASAYLAKAKAIRRVGSVIIEFLAQIEEFQKKLWLKKKFVVKADWCMTLNYVNTMFYDEIVGNQAQADEWVNLFGIDKLEGYSRPLTKEFLHNNQTLVLDTQWFCEDFQQRLVASIDYLDDKTDGLLVHSENFGALNLLREKYQERVKCIYIDPPYNTDASKILYKNGYEHSSWLSLMESRLGLGREFLRRDGVVALAIDDYEMRYVNILLDQIFGAQNAISNIAIFTNPKGRDQEYVAQAHDYTLLYAKDKQNAITYNFTLDEQGLKKKYAKDTDGGAARELPLKRTGTGKYRVERPYMFYPFVYDDKQNKLDVIAREEYEKIYDAANDAFDDAYLEQLKKDYASRGLHLILPHSERGEHLRWRWGYDSAKKGRENGILFAKPQKNGGYAIYQTDYADAQVKPKSLWLGERYDASSKGTNLLCDMLGGNLFSYPKSIYTLEDNLRMCMSQGDVVLDFFAGSGTTGHATVNLNREDNGGRKYILAEMGEYFDTATKPRLLKAIYSPQWKGGQPQTRGGGVAQIIKVLRLESYEDALSNIELSEQKHGMLSLFGDEYLVRYLLDVEAGDSLLKIDEFASPFAYKLNVTQSGQKKQLAIDLCETFEYLLGLHVVKKSGVQRYAANMAASSAKGEMQLQSDNKGRYAFCHTKGRLPDGKRALVLWRDMTGDLASDSAALNAYFELQQAAFKTKEFDVIYVNCDNTLTSAKRADQHWQVKLIEHEFKARMFDGRTV